MKIQMLIKKYNSNSYEILPNGVGRIYVRIYNNETITKFEKSHYGECKHMYRFVERFYK